MAVLLALYSWVSLGLEITGLIALLCWTGLPLWAAVALSSCGVLALECWFHNAILNAKIN